MKLGRVGGLFSIVEAPPPLLSLSVSFVGEASSTPYPIMKCGDTGIEIGVPGHIIDGSEGELVRE